MHLSPNPLAPSSTLTHPCKINKNHSFFEEVPISALAYLKIWEALKST